MDKLFLLDAYALIYRSYYAFITNPRINTKGFNTSAVFGFVNTLEDVLKNFSPTHIAVAFDPSGGTFRHEAYPEYKAQREATPEDIRLSVPVIKEIIKAYRIPILEVKGYEADDVIGTVAAMADKLGMRTYMMTPDKDYAQLVTENVIMYRPANGKKPAEMLGVDEVKKKYGLENPKQVIDMLGLMGDSADNIPGCPGVGPKRAETLIGKYHDIENVLANADKIKGKLGENLRENAEQIKFSKFLATIKCDVPIDIDIEDLKKKEIDKTALRVIFEEMEFNNLISRIIGEDAAPAETQKEKKKEEAVQMSLFDAVEENMSKSTEKKVEILEKMPGTGKDDFKNQNLRTWKEACADYHLIDNEEDMRILASNLASQEFFSLDTETTSVEPFLAKLVGLSFSWKEKQGFYVPVPDDEEEAQKVLEIFRPAYENENILKIGQNIKYDMTVLGNYGISLRGEIFDTMIAHYVLQPELRHNMDYMAEAYLGYQTVHIEELIGPKGKKQKNMRELAPEDIYVYACEDADITLQLKLELEKELEEYGLGHLFYDMEMPLLPVLARMERNGVTIDTEALKKTSQEYTQRMMEIEKTVRELAGMDFNVGSPKQVGEVLFDNLKISKKAKKTKTGQYVTSEAELMKYADEHEIVKKILDWRGLKKLLSTYIDNLPTLIDPNDGRIHTTYNQTVTATGRLSSSNPNLQNIPVRDDDGKEIRKAFIPEEGCLFFSADYSQIELRIMAHLSGDKNMIEAFREGHDIHQATAAKVYKKDLEEVTKSERSKAKTANFGIIYGISAFGLAQRMDVPRKEASQLIKDYFLTYPDVKKYMDESIEKAREKGYITTISGRRRYLPDINSHNAVVRGYAERNAINAPIQGSAADIIKAAMVRVRRRFDEEGLRSKMILQVHDELNFSVIPEEKDAVQRIVIEEMENAYEMSVPLKADFGWGDNWLEAH